jgi:hypothetical protein
MLPISRVISVLFVLGFIFDLTRQQPQQTKSDVVRIRTHIIEQKYCRADADLFTVSLKLDIEVFNLSQTPIVLPPKMIPWVAKVAASVKDAESGRYLFEVTRSHYLQDSGPGNSLRVEPQRATTLHTGYDLVAKYDPAFKYPKTLFSGSYALILLLKPETEQVTRSREGEVVPSLTTEPFVLDVSDHPVIIDCEGPPGTKDRR